LRPKFGAQSWWPSYQSIHVINLTKAHLHFLKYYSRYGFDFDNVIIQIMWSVFLRPNVITLSGFHYTFIPYYYFLTQTFNFRSFLNSPLLNRRKKMSMKSSSEDIEPEAAEVLPDLNDDFDEDSGNESTQRATSSNRAYHNLETFQRKNLRQKVSQTCL
jgi:hypothetical protein